MAKKAFISTKRLQIDKANATMVGIVATAAFISVFSLVACKALLSQRSYQSRVIAEKTKALNQLKENNTEAEKLVDSYQQFVSEPINIIKGNSSGSGDRDGDSAKIVLDALPSKYDFPALATSIEKLLTSPELPRPVAIETITGVDDEINQSQQAGGTVPVEIPFEIGVTGEVASIQTLIGVLQRSIRPVSIRSLTLSGGDASLQLQVIAKTYYQPQRNLDITTKVVK